MDYKHIIVEIIETKVGLITLNKPQTYNALSSDLIKELSLAVKMFDENPLIGAIVLTGGKKVFAAGVDINELVSIDSLTAHNTDFITKEWQTLENHNKPIIAAVCGYALGGGCELSLMCDIVICDKTAKFGQPEIKLGTMPGIGGTQRLTRAIGKSKSMYLCLTGDMLDANEAKSYGLVANIIENADVIDEAIKIALKISSMSQPVVRLIKDSINNSFECSLNEGLKQERKSFYNTLDLKDKKHGMKAFLNKTKPTFINE